MAWTEIDTTAVAAIREQFPALERYQEEVPVAYFDGPGGTQVPRAVAEAMLDYLYHHNANTHWNYPSSAETDAALEGARETFAAFFNGAPSEVVFGPNMTSLTLHLGRALGRRLVPGDEILVTELDHHANIDPWRALETECGVIVRSARMRTEDGRLDWQDFERLLTARTRLVAVGHASNALGTITDVRWAIRRAHDVGALAFVDGVHYAHHQRIDVQALECDFYACSPYKFYGPHLGTLWARHDLLAELDFARLAPAAQRPPDRAETGTQSHEAIVGAAAAVEWLGSLSPNGSLAERLTATFSDLHRRASELTRRLWSGLDALDGVVLYGPAPETPRTATISFTVAGVPSSQVVVGMARCGLFASHGDFYAQTVVDRLGLQPEGLVRVGCAAYTTLEEVDRLVEAVRGIVSGRADPLP